MSISVVYAISRSYWRYLKSSVATVPDDVEVLVAWYDNAEPPEETIHPRLRIVRPDYIAENFRKAYAVNVAIRQATTDWIVLADADMLFPSFFFGLLDAGQDRMVVTRTFIGYMDTELSENILEGAIDWEKHFTDYTGRGKYVPPRLIEKIVSKTVRTLFSRLDVKYGRGRIDYYEIYGAPNPSIYSRELLNQLHGYDERYEGWGGEDDDLSRRARQAGAQDCRLPVLVGHLHHGEVSDFAGYYDGANWQLGKGERPTVANPEKWGDMPASPAEGSVNP